VTRIRFSVLALVAAICLTAFHPQALTQTPPAQAPASPAAPASGKPLKLAIAGLVHGHVRGFLTAAQKRTDVQIVGLYESDETVLRGYGERYKLGAEALFTDLDKMLDQTKPDAVAAFTNTYDHPKVVEAAADRHLPVMMEKPLAVSMEHARRIQQAAAKGSIQVVVNYETSWYPSHGAIWDLVQEKHALGDIRKMVAMDGHEGPKEINVQPEFLNWLTDPVKNGAGALFDFGCYGANLMTWLMNNQRPKSVTAIIARNKPAIYAKVDDEATILVQYEKAQGIMQASWNWPFGRKDFEVYGEHGYAIATGGGNLRTRLPKGQETSATPDPLPADQRDSISYLTAVVRGAHKSSGLSALDNNMIVTEILEAARESARTGKTIELP
jgi:predicted dehydrogenase